MTQYWLSPYQFVESILFGLLFGIWFIAVNRLSDKWELERLSFGKIIIVKSGIYLLGFGIISVVIFMVISSLGFYQGNLLEITYGPNMIFLMVMFLVTLVLLILLLNFILQSIKNMGHYNLSSFLTGKYHSPVAEDRTFMFLDLKSSTAHAERLGYLLYSEMIKESIHDINKLLNKYDAEVYQYVGDEIVLTWKTDSALKNLNFLGIYYAFQSRIQGRALHYLTKYNALPEFKAGCNSGRVTVTEIGVVKRAIAFHGDVLNTASRIENLCNSLGSNLLISGHLKDQIGNIYSIPYQFESFGGHQLKGKHDRVEVFSVKEKKNLDDRPPAEMKVVS